MASVINDNTPDFHIVIMEKLISECYELKIRIVPYKHFSLKISPKNRNSIEFYENWQVVIMTNF